MSFIEFEYWQVAAGNEETHHERIRQWFAFVREHHAELFEPNTVVTEYWEPQETDRWFDFPQ
jgi:hypothetical protein